MKNKLELRLAERSELEWINERYSEVGFMHSNFDMEIIGIAEFEGQKAGLGRLIKIDEKHLELGGMYVFESFRGKGIAEKLVRFLLGYVKPFQRVYCIPFEHLLHFYTRCGFTNCAHLESVPSQILDKHRWCQEKYTHPTALLVRQAK